MDIGALYRKVILGDSSADVVPGYNVLRADNPNNPLRGFSPYFQREQPTQTQQANNGGGNPNNNPTPTGPSGQYGGSGGAGTSYNPGDLAYLDDQRGRLERQKGSVDKAYENGLAQLGDSYNREVSKANTDRSRALEKFSMQRDDTTRDKDQALGKVDTNARTLAESLRRRLGLASGANSSAYQIAAPDAVSRQASAERSDVQSNFGENFRNLDLAERNAKSDFETLLEDLAAQRKSRESDFRSGIEQQRNSVDEGLGEIARQRALLLGGGYDQVKNAMAPYTNAIDQRQATIDNLFNQFRTPFNVKEVNVQTPELADYTVDRAAINANQGQGQDPYSPYRQFLRRREDEIA